MSDRRILFYAVLEIGCIMTVIGGMINSITGYGIALMTLSALAIRVQEEKVFRGNHFRLWSEMKSEAAEFYFKCGVSMIIMAIVMTNTVITIAAILGLYLMIVATGKTCKKRFVINTSCESVYRTIKFFRITPKLISESKILRFFGITSERCSELMKFKKCPRVAA
ncbi:MAG: hypothetical protein KAS78_06050 [Candidatus Pacebacteria bacterium]|nr:hypothetical protein [Candidatus Paceibacterota bacterium]